MYYHWLSANCLANINDKSLVILFKTTFFLQSEIIFLVKMLRLSIQKKEEKCQFQICDTYLYAQKGNLGLIQWKLRQKKNLGSRGNATFKGKKWQKQRKKEEEKSDLSL